MHKEETRGRPQGPERLLLNGTPTVSPLNQTVPAREHRAVRPRTHRPKEAPVLGLTKEKPKCGYITKTVTTPGHLSFAAAAATSHSRQAVMSFWESPDHFCADGTRFSVQRWPYADEACPKRRQLRSLSTAHLTLPECCPPPAYYFFYFYFFSREIKLTV